MNNQKYLVAHSSPGSFIVADDLLAMGVENVFCILVLLI